MRTIELSDSLYRVAQERAVAGGFSSVNEYIEDLLEDQLGENPDLNHLFTPERLARIDAAAKEIDEGNFLTPEQLTKRLAEGKEAWLGRKSSQS